MDITKIKVGQTLTYKTARGTTGRGKVTDTSTTNHGAWITIHDKTRDKIMKVRPGALSK